MTTPTDMAQALRELKRNIAKEHLFSDAMDSAINAFVGTRYSINRQSDAAGEDVDGEKVMRRSFQAALLSYLDADDNQITPLIRAAYESRAKPAEPVGFVHAHFGMSMIEVQITPASFGEWARLKSDPRILHDGVPVYLDRPPEPSRDANKWRQAWIDERAHCYRAEGMKIEEVRIHAETDATQAAIAMAQESGDE